MRPGQRLDFDVDVFLTVLGVVQVQVSLTLARLAGLLARAGLTGLVARNLEVVRHLVAGAPDHRMLRTELLAIGRIGRQDAVLGIAQDVRFGQPFEKGRELGQGSGSVYGHVKHSLCQRWQFLPFMADKSAACR